MRVLLLCHEFFPETGGGAQGVGHLAAELAKHYQLDVVTKRCAGLPSRESQGNLTIYRVPAWGQTTHGYATVPSIVCYTFFACLQACVLLLRYEYRVVNGHFGIPAGSIAVFLGRLFRVPSVVTLLGAEIYDPPQSDQILAIPLVKGLVGWTIRWADSVVGLSRSMIRHVQNDFEIFRPCEVVPFGISEVPELRTSPSRSVPKKNELRLLCVARLVSRKRHLDLLRSLVLLPPDLRVTLLIVGEGPEGESIVKLSKQLGVDSRVRLAGLLPDRRKWKAYCESDAFILVSNHECQGVVYVEAMQAGLPIIAGDNGGQCDFVEDELNAFIVPVGDVVGIARVIEKLARDPQLRACMSQESKRIAQTLTVAQTAARYRKIFDNHHGEDFA